MWFWQYFFVIKGHLHQIPYNIHKAIYYYSLAAEQNDSNAQTILGNIYYYGINVKIDINKAIKYYTLAANQNNSDAQTQLRHIYSDSLHVPLDTKRAIYYYTLGKSLSCSFFTRNVIYFRKTYCKGLWQRNSFPNSFPL